MKIKAYSRAERKEQILNTLLIKVQHGKKPNATMYQIAKSLDMSPSNHLMKILKEMAKDGQLNWYTTDHRPGLKKYVFMLPRGSYTPPKKQDRVIKLAVNGEYQQGLLL